MGRATSQVSTLFNDYDGFVEKFKPKKTTDDCYTPPEIYDVVADWVAEKYGRDRDTFVRPFWPGGDFEAFDYPPGCVVVDNPPFSILAKIKRFYLDRGIDFFLFAPSLTAMSGTIATEITTVVCNATVTYENGAKVCTSFVTSLGGDVVAESEPELSRRVCEANRARLSNKKRHVPEYTYPPEVITAARLRYLAGHGQRLTIRRGDCMPIRSLESQRRAGKAIFGGGLLLSERAAAEHAAAEHAAAERAAAERAAAERANSIVWELSEAERMAVAAMGR